MTPGHLLQYFEQVSEAPYAVPRLRRFIMDLAVRGKLLDQDPADEPASELLKRIEAERDRAIKEGGLKRGGVSTRLTGERPDLSTPRGWVLTTLGNLTIKITDGTHKTPTYVKQGVPFVSVKDFSGGRLDFSNTRFISPEEHAALYKRCDPRRGDILIGRIGTLGKAVLIDTDAEFSLFVSVGLIRFSHDLTAPIFLRLLLNSPYAESEFDRIKVGGGTHTNKLNLADLSTVVLPLPPLAEQHRIVAKVDELMAMCDELEAAQAKRERRRDRLVAATLHGLNNGDASPESGTHPTFEDSARFYFSHLPRLTTRPEHIHQLRQTILNLAVRGRLVSQDPNDEPASTLLMRIREERQQMGKSRGGPSAITVGEANGPFTLRSGWAWARFPQLGTFGRGKSKHRPRNDPILFEGGTHLFVQTGDVARSNGVIETFTGKYNEVGLAQSAKWPKGTLCITIAANIADSGILSFDACFPDSVVGFVPASVFPNARYFEYFIRTAKAELLEFAPATAQKNINIGILNDVLIPLPPLLEQHRIVAKVDELMALCDELGTRLTATAATRRQLLEATLAEALESHS